MFLSFLERWLVEMDTSEVTVWITGVGDVLEKHRYRRHA